ncbi:hypothetical protein KIPB_005512 [Kipferlia bialata]|uniref:Uncharacterized protein n=1 Tax=Kipferlia bialata TaxID=797122 RepID=A0A9K3CW45_9EUKA|nr:hypothetical protein KIPB_002075 [Kipferlia bialata]GIQ81657.1 hypothetical protein KIPB_002648 [Kipferlia bialata]GIQ81825.1 hypothetical protein KIPB_002849 [Kipferlia bialata]GIQ82501.1 hypothetical protein KIPB_003655 [Kipferlia bialata]GIQ82807.1 hypothetical protein KIPB_004011 [Kipferlia bialata]|eukprot:g2075.t1
MSTVGPLYGTHRTEVQMPSAVSDTGGELGRVQGVLARSIVLLASTANMARAWHTAEIFGRNYMREEFGSGILERTYLQRLVMPLLKAYSHKTRRLGLTDTSAVARTLLHQAADNAESWKAIEEASNE